MVLELESGALAGCAGTVKYRPVNIGQSLVSLSSVEAS